MAGSDISDKQKGSLNIGGQDYQIDIFLSINDVKKLNKLLNSEKDEYRRGLAQLIYDKILSEDSNRPSIDVIFDQPDDMFISYFNLLFQRYTDLRKVYEKHSDEEDPLFRFICATMEYMHKKLDSLINLQVNYPNIDEISNRIQHNFKQRLDELSKTIMPMIKSNFENYFNTVFPTTLKKIVDQMYSKEFANSTRKFFESINKTIAKLPFSNLSEDEKRKLCQSYSEWGKLGWTIIPNAPYYLYNTLPLDQKNANKVALGYCKEADMQELFILLHKVKGVKKLDLEEAIFDFQNKRYKSCALLLFSAIDAKLIRAQRNDDKRRGRRASGKAAGECLFNRIKKEHDVDRQIFLALSYYNLQSCLQKIFEDGRDFIKQPEVINRNFVNHGMITKKVTRKDCIQLFLFYYNLLGLLNAIKNK